MRYKIEETLKKYKAVWFTKEEYQKMFDEKEKFNNLNKKNGKKISVAKIANNIIAKHYAD